MENGKPAFSAILYTDGQGPTALLAKCRAILEKSVDEAGGELVVMDEPSPERTHANVYNKILGGIEKANAKTVFCCEHDVLYPASYFEEGRARRGPHLMYNRNVWHLNEHGFFKADWQGYFLSNLSADGRILRAAIATKLTLSQFESPVEAEPSDIGTFCFESSEPVVDIRHTSNFTGTRKSVSGYTAVLEPWGDYRQYVETWMTTKVAPLPPVKGKPPQTIGSPTVIADCCGKGENYEYVRIKGKWHQIFWLACANKKGETEGNSVSASFCQNCGLPLNEETPTARYHFGVSALLDKHIKKL